MEFSAGLLASYYAARHDLGFYRSASVTRTYEFSGSDQPFPTERLVHGMRAALVDTVKYLAPLQLSVAYEPRRSHEAVFLKHDIIRIRDVMKFRSAGFDPEPDQVSVLNQEQKSCDLATKLRRIHCEYFDRPDCIPSWRVTVMRYDSPWTAAIRPSTAIDVIFTFHHALVDGLSGLVFHRVFAERLYWHLSSSNVFESVEEISCPYAIEPPPLLEKLVGFESAMDIRPALLSSSICESRRLCDRSYREEDPVKDTLQIQLVEISNTHLDRALQLCRKYKITLTGFLHAAVVRCLARTTTDQTSIVGMTPFSMRKFTTASADDIVNHISFSEMVLTSALIDSIRDCMDFPKDKLQCILSIAQEFAQGLEHDLRDLSQPRILTTAVQNLPKLLASSSMPSALHERRFVYELSNLGNESTRSARLSDDFGIIPIRTAFTQCDTGPDPRIVINCVSQNPGPLVLAVTWQESAFPSSFIQELVNSIQDQFISELDLWYGYEPF